MTTASRYQKFLLFTFYLFAITVISAQPVDQAYNQKIREYTTDTRFLPTSVLDLPDDPKIPSPRRHFGDVIGAPGVMHHTEEIYGYYKLLSQASPFLKVQQVGTTEEGRPINLVIIGNQDAMDRLDYYQEQMALLADPRKMGSRDPKDVINAAKPVFYLNGGLHSTEMGSPEMLMELAYRLVASQSDEIKKIRENSIVLINPASEPDGRDKQVDWYYRYTKKLTDWEDGFRRSGPYWGKYIFHDNNRDGLQISAQLTKAIFKIYYDWHPLVMLDLHESVPLIYMSTGTGPYNETIDPITIGEWQVMANHDVTALASQGLPGAFTWAFYDGWYPGYGIWVANNHNSVGRFYETFGNAGANTYLRDLSDDRYAGDLVTSKQWYRPDPATAMVNWSARNNVNYMEAGVLAALSYTADNSRLLLRNFYQKGLNSLRKGKDEKPGAFVIPAGQHDPYMAAYLVNQLRGQQIEVHQADNGDYVVLLDQPYRNLAVSLLTTQSFPKDAKFPPYDDIAWTLGYLYGVEVRSEDSVKYAPSSLKMLTADAVYEGKVNSSMAGAMTHYTLNYKAQNTVLSALYWLRSANARAKAWITDAPVALTGVKDTLSPGSILFEGMTAEEARKMAAEYGLDLQATRAASMPGQREIKLPRVAIYHTWYYTQDEGWSRYTFDQRRIPYTSIDKDDLRAGNLRAKFDVILIPRVYGSASGFINGIDKKFGPMPYTKTAEYPSHGFPDATDDMTGGPGFEGMANLRAFLEAGGVVIGMDNTSSILANSGLVNDLDAYNASGLFHPGSIVNAKVRRTDSPVLYGFPEVFPIFKGNGPLLQVDKKIRDRMLLQYGTGQLKDEEEYTGPVMGLPDKEDVPKADKADKKKDAPYVLSGMVRNEQTIIGQGAIFNMPVGKGSVVAFTFDPLHRFLNLHDAPMVWNVLINWEKIRE